MRGRAVGIDITMKRLKNTTCGDRPLVNSVGLQSTFRLPTCSSKDHLFTESHTITPLSSRIDRRDETVRDRETLRPPPQPSWERGLVTSGGQPSWARNQQESGCIKLQVMVTIQIVCTL